MFVNRLAIFLVMIQVWALASCKSRGSDLSFKTGISELLDIAALPLEKKIDLCTRNILINFVGVAEGMGRYEFMPAYRDKFSKRTLLNWEVTEERLEEEYFNTIIDVGKTLENKFSEPPEACLAIRGEIEKGGKSLGSTTLVTLIDGPNHGAVGDTTMKAIRFGFNGDAWRMLEQ